MATEAPTTTAAAATPTVPALPAGVIREQVVIVEAALVRIAAESKVDSKTTTAAAPTQLLDEKTIEAVIGAARAPHSSKKPNGDNPVVAPIMALAYLCVHAADIKLRPLAATMLRYHLAQPSVPLEVLALILAGQTPTVAATAVLLSATKFNMAAATEAKTTTAVATTTTTTTPTAATTTAATVTPPPPAAATIHSNPSSAAAVAAAAAMATAAATVGIRVVRSSDILSTGKFNQVREYILAGMLDACNQASATDYPRAHLVYNDAMCKMISHRTGPYTSWPQLVPFAMSLLMDTTSSERNAAGCNMILKLCASGGEALLGEIAPHMVAMIGRCHTLSQQQPPSGDDGSGYGYGSFYLRTIAATAILTIWSRGSALLPAVIPTVSTLDLHGILALQGAAIKHMITVDAATAAASAGGVVALPPSRPPPSAEAPIADESKPWIVQLTILLGFVGRIQMDPEFIEGFWISQCALTLAPNTPIELRCRAFNVVIAIADFMPKIVRRNSTLQAMAADACIQMMSTHVTSDVDWCSDTSDLTDDTNDDGQDDDAYDMISSSSDRREPLATFGAAKIDRLCKALGDPFAVACVPLFTSLLQHQDWQYRAAGLTGFTQISEYVQLRHINARVPVWCKLLVSDPHPRVRYNAIRVCTQMANDHQPDFTRKYAPLILPALIAALDDTIPRVQGLAATGIFSLLGDVRDEDEKKLRSEMKKVTGDDNKDSDSDSDDDDQDGGAGAGNDDNEDDENGDEDDQPKKNDNKKPTMRIAPYFDAMMAKLVNLLRTGANHIKGQVLTALSSCAGTAPTRMSAYYDTVMPMMKAVMMHATTPDLIMLRARAIECVTYLGVKCKTQFKRDAAEVMGLLLDVIRSGHTQMGDKNYSYVLNAVIRICNVVKREFAPVLPLLMPSLFAALSRPQPDIRALRKQQHVAVTAADSERIGVSITAAKQAIADKAEVMDVIIVLVTELEDSFAPYFDATARAMLPMLQHGVEGKGSAIKANAYDSLEPLMKCGVAALKSGKLEKKAVTDVFMMLVESLVVKLTPPHTHDDDDDDSEKDESKDDDDEDAEVDAGPRGGSLYPVGETLGTLLEAAGSELANEVITDDILVMIAHRVVAMISYRSHHMMTRTQPAKPANDGSDEEQEDDDEMEAYFALTEQDEEYCSSLINLVDDTSKIFKARFIPAWNLLRAPILTLMTMQYQAPDHDDEGDNREDQWAELKRCGLDMYVDIIQNLPIDTDTVVSTLPAVIPCFLACLISDAGLEHRRTAAFGLGICAQQCTTGMTPYINATIARLLDLINEGDSKEEDNVATTDNAISSLGRIAMHQNRPDLWPGWLTLLPLSYDIAETEACYNMLCQLVESNNPYLLGANFANLPRILAVMCDILHKDHKKLVKPEVRTRIVGIITRLLTLPAEAIAALNASLTPVQRQTFADVIAKAQADAAMTP